MSTVVALGFLRVVGLHHVGMGSSSALVAGLSLTRLLA